ncbi:MAG TPA: HAD-IA family hydrolase [Chitinophagaceae bacterium]|nr:HAD-IA family hydrolase [Chitinophagaceae bacterium]
MAKDYKILFSDIGGVLLSNGWGHEARQAAAKEFGIDYFEMDILHDFIFNVYEIGKISWDDYLDTAVFNYPRNFSKKTFKEFMLSQSHELPDTLKWLVEWKIKHPKIKTISINNEPKDLNDYRIQKFRLHDFFDAFISSCEVGMRKPDPGIFRLALGIAQARPEECLYFDDREMLVEAARKEGIHAYQHKDLDGTRKIIEELMG